MKNKNDEHHPEEGTSYEETLKETLGENELTAHYIAHKNVLGKGSSDCSWFDKVSVSSSSPYTLIRGLFKSARFIAISYWLICISIIGIEYIYTKWNLVEPTFIMNFYNYLYTHTVETTIIPLFFSSIVTMVCDKINKKQKEHQEKVQDILASFNRGGENL